MASITADAVLARSTRMHLGTRIGVERVLAGLLLLLPLTGGAEAQAPGSGIRGTVFDQSGVEISWAVVKAENMASGHAYAAVASKAGDYWFRDLPAGSYLMTAFAPGFRTLQVRSDALHAGATAVLPLKLSRAAAAITVEVNASAGGSRTTMAARQTESGGTTNAPTGDLFQSHLTDLLNLHILYVIN